MARFVLLAGKYHRGRQKDNNRVTYKPGDVFETVTDKEAEYCRRYAENFREVAGPLPEYNAPNIGVVVPPIERNPVGEVKADGSIEVDLNKLKTMNMRDLLLFCRENGIETKGMRKEEVLKDIEASLS